MMSSLITEDVRKMRIKGDYQFMEMRAKCNKVKNSTLSSFETEQMPNWAKWDSAVWMGIRYSVLFLIVSCIYPRWWILHSSAIAWWCKTLREMCLWWCRENCLWTNMTFRLLMLLPCVLVAYEMIHVANAQGSKTDYLIL